MRTFHAVVPALVLISTGAFAAGLDDMPLAAGHVPSDYAAFDEVVPNLGQPFAQKVDGSPRRQFYPGAPVYFVYKGKVIGTTIELNQVDVDRGMSFDNIKMPDWLPPVDHFDFVHKSEGGRGLGPSFAVRVWFVGTDVLDKIQF